VCSKKRTDAGCREAYKKLEGEFETLLKELRPSENMIRVTRVMLEKHWTQLGASQEAHASGLKSELAKIERDVEHFLDRIAQTDVTPVITLHEEDRKLRLHASQLRSNSSNRVRFSGKPL
jgi:hypothetical protein